MKISYWNDMRISQVEVVKEIPCDDVFWRHTVFAATFFFFFSIFDLRLRRDAWQQTSLQKSLTMKRKNNLLHFLLVLLPWLTLSFSTTSISPRRVKKNSNSSIISLSAVEGSEIPELGKDGLYHVNTPMQHRYDWKRNHDCKLIMRILN